VNYVTASWRPPLNHNNTSTWAAWDLLGEFGAPADRKLGL